MKSYSDSFFTIGSSHKVCEDYALHNRDVAIVSDGCSSSKNTDIGARIVALSYKLLWKRSWRINNLHAAANIKAKISVLRIGLDSDCLDATALGIKIDSDTVNYFMHGDGYIIIKYVLTSPIITKISFAQDAPFYPNYLNDAQRRQSYEQTFSRNFKVTPDLTMSGTTYDIDIDDLSLVHHLEKKQLEYIIVCSDGFGSFVDSDNNPIKDEVIFSEITNFKSLKGSFIQRRINKAMKNFKKQGISHYDDISMAGFSFVNEG